jgi:signal peptidase I
MSEKHSSPWPAVVAALVVAMVFKFFVFDFMIVEGLSMWPALKSGSVKVVYHLAYGLRIPWTGRYAVRWRLPARGDVVVFTTPQGDIAVKRCAGVEHEGGGYRFVALGDNSLESYDSRSYGAVPVDDIIGQVLWVK